MRMGKERSGCADLCVDRIKVWYWEERSEPQCNVFDQVMGSGPRCTLEYNKLASVGGMILVIAPKTVGNPIHSHLIPQQ